MIQYQNISSSQVIYVVIEQSTRKQIKQFIIRLRFIKQTRLTRIQKITNATTKIIGLSQAQTETDTAKQRRSQNREEREERLAEEENVIKLKITLQENKIKLVRNTAVLSGVNDGKLQDKESV